MRGLLTDRVAVVEGDITAQHVDAIVNAANESLLGGGGVDGAIHRAAGPGLLGECRRLGGCKPGEAKITAGYNLPARFIIHTVGPVWKGGDHGEDALLAFLLHQLPSARGGTRVRTIAFPAISTGAFGFPLPRAAAIAVRTVFDHSPVRVPSIGSSSSATMNALFAFTRMPSTSCRESTHRRRIAVLSPWI